MFRNYLEKISCRKDLSREEAAQALEMIINGYSFPTEIGGFLMGLRTKGESVQEILGFVDTMEKHMIKVDLLDKNAIDVCGTGGDGSNSFNVSTTAAFVVSAGSVSVAKHGNRSISSHCGSADLLEALDIKVNLQPEQVKHCIDEIGIGFFFAPLFHPAMKAVVPYRKSLGLRTVFNMLGPLLSPACVNRQLVGTYDLDTARLIADVLYSRGYRKACTVHSDDGLDEVSPFAASQVFEVRSGNGGVKQYRYQYEGIKIDSAAKLTIQGNDSRSNAKITLSTLSGEKGVARDITVLNAAFGFYVAERTATISDGIQLAEDIIDSGAALEKLYAFRKISNQS